jgi:hypothetical protein
VKFGCEALLFSGGSLRHPSFPSPSSPGLPGSLGVDVSFQDQAVHSQFGFPLLQCRIRFARSGGVVGQIKSQVDFVQSLLYRTDLSIPPIPAVCAKLVGALHRSKISKTLPSLETRSISTDGKVFLCR